MGADFKRQVLALRPNARCVGTPVCGLIVYDGDEELANGDSLVYRETYAWFRAFQYLMVRFRGGADRP